ncbi:MAG: hypothetical protein ACT4QF_02970 [Sporichthyaceae bacterium]
MNVRTLSENFCAGYLWPDPEWVQFHDEGFSYWHGRLEQRFTVEKLDEELCAWRLDMPILGALTDVNAAMAAAVTLNQFTAGWSFWVHPEERTFHALAAMTAPLEWNRWIVRFSEVAKVMGWFCEAAVDPLARRLRGVPLISHPADLEAPREVPDAVNYYPTAQRERPEWVLDPVTGWFPPVEELARLFGERMEAPEVEADESTLRIVQPAEDGESTAWELLAGFSEHRLLGVAWRTELVLPQVPAEAVPTAALMATKALWDAPGANLLGSWVDEEGVLVYRQWNTSSELRNYGRIEEFDGTDDLLWSLTSPAADAAAWGQALPEEADWPTIVVDQDKADALLAEVFASLLSGAHPEFVAAAPEDSKADRTLLWLDRAAVLLLCGWFNPIGPTLATLEVSTSPLEDREQLVLYLRHPLLPEYRSVADVESPEQVLAAIGEAVAQMVHTAPPNVVVLSGCPEDFLPAITDALRAAVGRVAAEAGTSLVEERARVLATLGDPWAYAGEEREEGADLPVAAPKTDDEFAEWLDAVTAPENVVSNMIQFGRAWDGSLNYLRSTGNLHKGQFDIGPMLLLYSDVGLVPQQDQPTEN